MMTLSPGTRFTGRFAITAFALVAGLALGWDGVAQEVPKGTKPAPAPPKQLQQQPPQQQVLQVPPPEVLLVLIRSAMIGLDQANRTGNYSVLRELGGPALQQLSTAQLANAFANLRTAKVDLLVAAIATPQLTQQPTIAQQGGLLQLVGFFPTQPRQIQFHIIYQPAGGEWRLAGLNVGLAEAPPANGTTDSKGGDGKDAAPGAKAKQPATPPNKK
jgi:hypothetical protein